MSSKRPRPRTATQLKGRALLLALSFFGWEELLAFQRVSREWQEAVKSTLSLIRSVSLEIFDDDDLPAALRCLGQLTRLSRLTLTLDSPEEGEKKKKKEQQPPVHFEALSSLSLCRNGAVGSLSGVPALFSAPGLREFTLSARWWDVALAPLIERFPGLTSLSLPAVSIEGEGKEDLKAAPALLSAPEPAPQRWKQLHTLWLGGGFYPVLPALLSACGPFLPALTELTAEDNILDCKTACALLRALPSLTSFSIRDSPDWVEASEEIYEFAASALPPPETHGRLEVLSLFSFDPVLLNAIALAFRLPRLRRVDLEEALYAEEFNSLPALLSFRESLQELRISECGVLHLEFPEDLPEEERSFPRLRSVCFEGSVCEPFHADDEVMQALTPASR